MGALLDPQIIAALIVAIPPTVIGLVTWRATRKVHTIVNSQRSAMVAKIEALEREVRALRAAIAGGD